MNTYLFSYRYQGFQYSLKIPAESIQEAKERLKVIPFAINDGTLIATIPAIAGSWLPSLICAIRNWYNEHYNLVRK